MSRIAVILGGFPNLSETFILDQLTGLIDRGHEIEIFAARPLGASVRHEAVDQYRLLERTHYYFTGWSTPGELALRTVRAFVRAPLRTLAMLWRWLDPRAWPKGLEALGAWPLASLTSAAGRFDVALAHFGTNAALAERARTLGGLDAPIVATFLGKDLSHTVKRKGARYYRELFARGELMLSVSEQFKERLIKLGCPQERVRVHRLGVDTRAFRFQERRLAPGERVRLLSMCRLVEKKGLDYGMRAFARVAQLGAGFTWHIAGDGPLRAPLEALARELGVGDRVVFHGPVTRARALELLATAHACLAPSVTAANGDQEGLPVTIVESTACGLPVVATRHSGIPELVRHSETGYLAPERDVETLAGMLATLALENGRWPAMGRRGREIIEAEYDVHLLNDRLSALLEETARQGRRTAGR